MQNNTSVEKLNFNTINNLSEVKNRIVFVEFMTEWSGGSYILTSILKKIKDTYTSDINVFQVDIEDQPELKNTYNISDIPSLLVFHQGKIIDRIHGVRSFNELDEKITKEYLKHKNQFADGK